MPQKDHTIVRSAHHFSKEKSQIPFNSIGFKMRQNQRAYEIFLRWYLDDAICDLILIERAILKSISSAISGQKRVYELCPDVFDGWYYRKAKGIPVYDPNSADELTKPAREVRERSLNTIKVYEKRLSNKQCLAGKIDEYCVTATAREVENKRDSCLSLIDELLKSV